MQVDILPGQKDFRDFQGKFREVHYGFSCI